MKKVLPVTYYLDYSFYPERVRKSYLREAAVNGMKHVVLNERMVGQIMRDPAFAEVLQQEVAGAGLSFLDSHAPFGPAIDMNSPFEDEHRLLVLRHKLHLNIARLMDVDTMTIHVGNDYRFPEFPLEKHVERIFRMLDAILPEAEACKVTVCIENIWLQTNTPEMLIRFKEKFPSEYLGFCFDSGHANIMNNGRHHSGSRAHDGWQAMGKAMPDWDDRILEKMLPYIVTCHLHDNMGAQDEHNLPGRGNVDWDHISKVLPSAPNIKLLQSEVIPLRNSVALKELSEKFNLIFG